MDKGELTGYRNFLKDHLRLEIDFQLTDQSQGVAPPPVQKPPRAEQQSIPLPEVEHWSDFSGTDLLKAINRRRSHRRFKDQSLSLAELGMLLWATQGVKGVIAPGSALRTVPSAGCRHPFESYLLVSNVDHLQPGLYRYLPVEHCLVREQNIDPQQLKSSLLLGTLGQEFTATAPVCFAWTVIPYRSEWRYHTAAHRVILMDVGHLCQNLYLAVEAIGCGTCAIAAYHQDAMDELLGVDGEEEFTIYLAPVGKV
jgi:SagB-type dehydrogenase family enzyme